MNISIIDSCNNDCFYCFQNNSRTNRQMSLEQVNNILNWYNHLTAGVGIIGGEPTLHPQFLDICKLCLEKCYHVNIFTNLLCNKDIVKQMLMLPNMSFLINVQHNEINKSRFEENFNLIFERSLEKMWELNSAIFLGITITGDEDYDDHNYTQIYELLNKDIEHKIKGIRISHAIPYNDNYKLNYKFGEQAQDLILKTKQINPLLSYSFDCAVNHCIMSEEIYYRLKRMNNIYNLRLMCDEPPLDIDCDFKTKWCACTDKEYYIYDYIDAYTLFNNLTMDHFLNLRKIQSKCNYKNCNNIECCGLCEGINNKI